MNISIKVRPTKYNGKSKSDILEKITRGFCYASGIKNNVDYSGYVRILSRSDESVRVFNLHKHNRKVIHKKDKIGNPKVISIQKMYWEAFVYDIPIELLKIMKCDIKQNLRNFEFIKHK